MTKKLSEADQDFIIELAETGKFSLSEIKQKLESERNVVIKSKQTVSDVITKHKEGRLARSGDKKAQLDESPEKPSPEPRIIKHPDGLLESPPPAEFDKDEAGSGSDSSITKMHHTGSPVSKISAMLLGGSSTAIYAKLIEYCRSRAVGNEVLESMLKNCTDSRHHWRAIVIYAIDILRAMAEDG